MTFKVEFRDGDVLEWRQTESGATVSRNHSYRPSIYVAADTDLLADLRAELEVDPKVAETAMEEWHTHLRSAEREPVLRVDLHRVDEVRTVAREIRTLHERGDHAPGTFRLFNVDFTPQFRYCIDTGTKPVSEQSLSTLQLGVNESALADETIARIEIDGDPVRGAEDAVLQTVQGRLDREDPDILVVSHPDLVPLLYDRAAACGFEEFQLGRLPGVSTLAGKNSYEHDGHVGYSPARYDVPGRVLVDASSSFLWRQTGIDGIQYLVEQSWQPLQEVAAASIGSILTAMQTRHALNRDVLVPWNKWEPEQFKSIDTLHAADRGGFIFEPRVGLHEDVYEVDFESLYPNIICEHNVSPETVDCDCHPGRADVPELGYGICDHPGFLPAVLEPLVEDRRVLKQQVETATGDEADTFRARSNALKWVLVACFGYQGYRNSKFGRIECHEAINAIARDILLQAKAAFEAAGWEVVHGIIDSLWVAPRHDDPESLSTVVDRITDQVDVNLERECRYEWICFVPKRSEPGGALNRYFGKPADGEFTVRGIEARQHSTPAYVKSVQREFLETLDRHRDPESVCDILKRRLRTLRAGDVPPDELVVTKRVRKSAGEYQQRTRTAAALERARARGLDRYPGQRVRYVVVDDSARGRNRVQLAAENPERYDAAFYADLLVRACASVVSPLGWTEADIRTHLRDGRNLRLTAFE